MLQGLVLLPASQSATLSNSDGCCIQLIKTVMSLERLLVIKCCACRSVLGCDGAVSSISLSSHIMREVSLGCYL